MNEHGTCSQQIEKLSPKTGDLLVVSIPHLMTKEQRERMSSALQAHAERMGFKALVLDGGATAQLQPDLGELLAEQRKQTALLEQIATQNLALIEALADDQGLDPEQQPMSYLSGAPVHGGR
ncbi:MULTISPECIES: hypothetical protein [Pseudomonas chlororaphis group]|uniref:hypothetical protein n=1 Tax=Pseudomonas chlororaphis group TaxID=136842 RepID=UPI002096DD09|nr:MULTISPECIES: hypothetical protein [Pseudomonas chlororaphis group]MCO7575338.1 hypothetical protein [Pseudomonas protegens]MCO7582559.1 hypothetical protein [Pseudomonas chlororaphis]MCO7599262.1 hypothetical protein [Pseudomonas chlororaphis]